MEGDKTISGIHCTISFEADGSFAVRDNDSSNGTFLNYKKITRKTPLLADDVIEIGRSRFSVQVT